MPIVVGMCLFDLGEGDGTVRPGAAEGRAGRGRRATTAPSRSAVSAPPPARSISKWRGPDHARPGGLVGAVARSGELIVAALVAVNASGDIDDGTTTAAVLDGSFVPPEVIPFVENTTIGVVATNAGLTKAECHLVAQSAHDGYGRALVPAHTVGDGDAVVAAATGTVEAEVAAVRVMATTVVEAAIRSLPAPL